MSDVETNGANNEINKVLLFLLPELDAFKALAKDMVKINSPYQKEFNYLTILLNMENQNNDPQKTIALILEELTHFSQILDKISTDNDAIELYSEDGLLDKYLYLQKNMQDKLSLL